MADPENILPTGSMDGADKRHRRLLLLQKKMQMSDAMEKKLQMSSKQAGGNGRLSSSLIQTINDELDKAITAEDFHSASHAMTPTKRSSSRTPNRSKSEMSRLNRSSSKQISLSDIKSSPFLQEKIAEMERSGKIQRTPVKIPTVEGNKQTRIQDSGSLPDINSTRKQRQAGPSVELPSPTFLPSAPSPSPKAAGGNKFKVG